MVLKQISVCLVVTRMFRVTEAAGKRCAQSAMVAQLQPAQLRYVCTHADLRITNINVFQCKLNNVLNGSFSRDRTVASDMYEVEGW